MPLNRLYSHVKLFSVSRIYETTNRNRKHTFVYTFNPTKNRRTCVRQKNVLFNITSTRMYTSCRLCSCHTCDLAGKQGRDQHVLLLCFYSLPLHKSFNIPKVRHTFIKKVYFDSSSSSIRVKRNLQLFINEILQHVVFKHFFYIKNK